jgi:hypothetical protein
MANPKTSETSGTNKEEKQDKIITQKTKKEQNGPKTGQNELTKNRRQNGPTKHRRQNGPTKNRR